MHTMMITPELLGLLPNSSNTGGNYAIISNIYIHYTVFCNCLMVIYINGTIKLQMSVKMVLVTV